MTIVELAQYEELHNKFESLVVPAWKEYVLKTYPNLDNRTYSYSWLDMDKPGIFVCWTYWSDEKGKSYMLDVLPLESVTLKQP